MRQAVTGWKLRGVGPGSPPAPLGTRCVAGEAANANRHDGAGDRTLQHASVAALPASRIKATPGSISGTTLSRPGIQRQTESRPRPAIPCWMDRQFWIRAGTALGPPSVGTPHAAPSANLQWLVRTIFNAVRLEGTNPDPWAIMLRQPGGRPEVRGIRPVHFVGSAPTDGEPESVHETGLSSDYYQNLMQLPTHRAISQGGSRIVHWSFEPVPDRRRQRSSNADDRDLLLRSSTSNRGTSNAGRTH